MSKWLIRASIRNIYLYFQHPICYMIKEYLINVKMPRNICYIKYEFSSKTLRFHTFFQINYNRNSVDKNA